MPHIYRVKPTKTYYTITKNNDMSMWPNGKDYFNEMTVKLVGPLVEWRVGDLEWFQLH